MTALCLVGDSCRGRDTAGNQIQPRLIHSTAYICGVCTARLTCWIIELPTRYEDLAERLSTGSGMSEPVAGSRSTGLELNEAAADCRSQILAILRSWARVVCEERGIYPPANDEPRTVAAWLHRHVDWIAHQPFAAEPYREIDNIRRDAWRLINPSGRKKFPLPRHRRECPNCGGIMYAVIADGHADTLICCDSCDAQWLPVQWFRLGRRILANHAA